MSKQSEAKARQCYIPKAVPNVCGNCAYFASDKTPMGNPFGSSWTHENNMRCRLGGFAVRKMGTCNEWTKITV